MSKLRYWCLLAVILSSLRYLQKGSYLAADSTAFSENLCSQFALFASFSAIRNIIDFSIIAKKRRVFVNLGIIYTIIVNSV